MTISQKITSTSFFVNIVGVARAIAKVSADHHIRHHSPGRYQCDKCSKMFHKKYTLEAHLNMYSEKGYQCTYLTCDRVYKLQGEYNRHLLTHTQPKEKVSCSVCGKSFNLKKYLDEHLEKTWR